MRNWLRGKRLILGLLGLLLLGLGGLAWAERQLILSWYYLRGLRQAEGDAIEVWAGRVARLDQRAVPGLLPLFGEPEEAVCDRAGVACTALLERWGREDARSVELVQQLVKNFAQFSGAGRKCVLKRAEEWMAPRDGAPYRACLVQAIVRLLPAAGERDHACTQAEGARLARVVLEQTHEADVLASARTLARACFKNNEVETRIAAIQLA